jgi:ataxia telangiectasia mutated family protein
MGTSSFQPHQVTEDDFGEIKIAESETMPLSREAIECRRTSTSLMSQLVRYRLCGAMFTSPSGHPGRDLTVINAWLAAEGPRFIQLGLVVCDALQDGLLRLNMSAVDAVLETLEEMVGSYGYSRNEGLLEIALAFLGHSAWVWVSPEASSTDIPERAIILARFLLRKTKRGQIASWRVRLAMILFLDEFLDYDDATTSLWSKFREEDEMDTEDNDITPFAYMQSALVDIDARVRIRAATSSAAVFLLEDFPAQKHPEFYFDALSRQPGQRDHWDSFMNHLVWKLNCCIASVTIRATVMFHLYEIPPTTPTIHQHFQHGVHAVAQRLHLSSISDLFKPYASIICLSQLESGQKTIMQPFRLYGFPTKAAFGSALLNMVGPSALIESNGFVMFKDACEASSTPITWAFKQHLPAAAALAYIEAVGRGGASPEIETHVISTFSKARSHVDDDISSMITHRIDSVFAQLLVLMDLEATSDVVRLQIHTVNTAGSDPETFCTLIPIEEEGNGDGTIALNPCHPSSAILLTHSYLLSQYPSANPAKIVLLAFDMLFRLLHDTFLAAEEKRYLRCLALVVALFHKTVREPVILQTFLRELIALLDKIDYPDIVVRMLRWGFQQVQPGDDQLHDLPAIMVELGEVRQRIGMKGKTAAATCLAVDTWLATQVQQWTTQEGFQKTLDFALSFWPKEITAFFNGWTEPTFIDLSSVAEMPASKSFSSMTLCFGLAKGIKTGDRDDFVKKTFWHLRATLSKAGATSDGVSGLLDLLDQVDGDIHAPSLDTVVALSQDRTLQRFSDRLAREPATLLRVVLVTKVAELTHHMDYRIRSVAMEVLRKSYQTINDLLARKTVFGTDTATTKSSLPPKPLLELLVPLDTPNPPSTATLDALQSDETWVKRSLSPDIWASQLAILLCNVLSTDDVFYSCFVPLLEPQAGCASTMLPWLVQSLLTCGSAKSKLVAESRSSLLSRYFTQIIQWSQASVGAVQIIIWIVLHLRGFAPAFRAGVLAFDHWLEIDPVLLSEAAIKCGAFASALMFLEMKHDDDAQRLDLLDPRVQNVSPEPTLQLTNRSCTRYTAMSKILMDFTGFRRMMSKVHYFADCNTRNNHGGLSDSMALRSKLGPITVQTDLLPCQ